MRRVSKSAPEAGYGLDNWQHVETQSRWDMCPSACEVGYAPDNQQEVADHNI
jgi:hypothetical protein